MNRPAHVSSVDVLSAACRAAAANVPAWRDRVLVSTSTKAPEGRKVAILDRGTGETLASATGPDAPAAYETLLEQLERLERLAARPRTPAPHGLDVVRYRLAYGRNASIDLCAACAACAAAWSGEALGEVLHGAHRGVCALDR